MNAKALLFIYGVYIARVCYPPWFSEIAVKLCMRVKLKCVPVKMKVVFKLF